MALAGDASGTSRHEETLDEDSVSDFMNKTRPKDAWSGLKSGLATVGSGLACSVGAVVASTAVRTQKAEEGALHKTGGCLKGLGIGVLAGLGTAVVGVVGGTAQIARGVKSQIKSFFFPQLA